MPIYVGDNQISQIYKGDTAFTSLKLGDISLPIVETVIVPSGAFTLSGAGNADVNGCYSEAGTHNGMPYYSNGTYFVWYEGYEWAWFINQTVGTGAPLYMGSDQNNVPSSWSEATGSSPAPTLANGCGGATTTTAAPTTTTTTTTTSAPGVAGYIVSGAGDATYNGTYCQAGIYNSKPYYVYNNRYLYHQFAWWLHSSLGHVFETPKYSNGSSDYFPPVSPWTTESGGTAPAPTLTQTTCGEATTTTTTTTTTTAAPTTTTTTTAAPGKTLTVINGVASGSGTSVLTQDAPLNGLEFVVSDAGILTMTRTNSNTAGTWISGPEQAGFMYDDKDGIYIKLFSRGVGENVIAGTYYIINASYMTVSIT